MLIVNDLWILKQALRELEFKLWVSEQLLYHKQKIKISGRLASATIRACKSASTNCKLIKNMSAASSANICPSKNFSLMNFKDADVPMLGITWISIAL